MDPQKFTMAAAVAVAVALGLPMAIAFVVRPPLGRAAAVTPLAQMAGFLLAFGLLFKFPRTLTPELWLTPVFAVIVAGVLSTAVVVVRRGWLSWTIRVVAASGAAYAVFACKLPEYRSYLLFVFAGQCLLLLALEPLAKAGAPAAVVPLAFVLSAGALAFTTLYAIDQNTGQLIALLSAIMGAAAVAGLWKRTAPMAQAATPFAAILLPAQSAIAAFYNPDAHPLPMILFFWLAGAPLAAVLAYVPWLRRRPWWCLAAVFALSLAILIPAVMVTLKFAAPIDQPDPNW